MVDVSKTVQAKSDQLNADDLMASPITVKVTKVSRAESPDQPLVINYEGDNGKPYKPCKSMRRVLLQVWGKDGQGYVGRSMTLYRDPAVKFGGVDVGGIRISHMSDLKEKMTLALTATRGSKKPFVVQPLAIAKQAASQPQAEIDPAVKAAGEKAASEGEDKYKEWLASLTPEVKATVRPLHKDLSAKALAADAAKEKVEDVDASDDFDDVNGDDDSF